MNLELRWLRSFVLVAEEMHFSRAARRLHVAQSALTTQIRQLEQAVGAPLFVRTNRMGGLTAAGRALLPEARAILERSGQLATRAKQAAAGETGLLRLGVIPPAATPDVARGIRRFTEAHPGIELTVQQADQERLIQRLNLGELDIVVGRPAATGRTGPLRQVRLQEEVQGVVLRAEDPLARGGAIPVRALDGRNLLLLQGNPHFGQVLLAHGLRHGARLRPVFSAQDFPSLHWMVQAGLGLAPCSLLLAAGLPRGLVAKPLSPAPPRLAIHALWRGPQPEPAAARLIAALQAAAA